MNLYEIVERAEGNLAMQRLAFYRVQRAAEGYTFSQVLGPNPGTFLEKDLLDEVEAALTAKVNPVSLLMAIHQGVLNA